MIDLSPAQIELLAYVGTLLSFTLSALFGALVVR